MRFGGGLEAGGRSSRRVRAIALAVVFVVVALLSLAVFVATARADESCDVRNGTNSYGTLQAAVTDAQVGDTIEVRGTCVGATIVDRDVTILGVDSPHGPPTLDGQKEIGTLRGSLLVTVAAGVRVQIKHLVIANGLPNGIRVLGSLALEDSIVRDNFSVSDVGGVFVEAGGSAVITQTTFTGNVCQCSFAGAIMNRGDLVVRDSVLEGSLGFSGAVFNIGVARIEHSIVRRTNGELAGGIFNGNGGTLFVRNSTVAHNAGTGIFNGGQATIEATAVIGNTGNVVGGIANATIDDEPASLEVVRSTIAGNVGAGLVGGIYNPEASQVVVTASRIAHNSGSSAGGIHNSGLFRLDHTTVTGNRATATGGGGGALNQWPGTLTAVASTISGNSPTDCVGC